MGGSDGAVGWKWWLGWVEVLARMGGSGGAVGRK